MWEAVQSRVGSHPLECEISVTMIDSTGKSLIISEYRLGMEAYSPMKEKMMRFMQGRYGVDSFNRFLMWAMIVSAVLSVVTRIGLFYWISIAVLIYAYYRMLSRDYAKRSAENQKYMQTTYRLKTSFNRIKSQLKDKKTHRIFKCPQCRQKIRVPKGHGKIAIRCPKCSTEFIKKV